jgi:hypothetical protein
VALWAAVGVAVAGLVGVLVLVLWTSTLSLRKLIA